MASCQPRNPGTNVVPGTTSDSGTTDEETKNVWATEDAAHVSEEVTGKANTGDAGIDLSGIPSADRASILGDVEAWARKNHLLGIPLFGDGGWSLYSKRIQSPIKKQYVPNYGFGILREGKVTASLNSTQEPNSAYADYIHLGVSEADGLLNPFDSNNSGASTMLSYISGTLYSQRLVKDGNGGYQAKYEWYDSLADGDPEPLDFNEQTQTATKWKVKVRTGTDSIPVKYKTTSTATINGTKVSTFNNRGVTAQDYVNAYRLLLNGFNKYSYATQSTTNYVGAAKYYEDTKNIKVFSPEDDAAWAKVGIKVLDDNHIEIDTTSSLTKTKFKVLTTSFTPVNEEFYKLVTDWNGTFEPKNYGTSSSDKSLSPADTLLSVGPYTLKTYSAGTGGDNEIVFDRNDEWVDIKRENNDKYEIYSIKGIHYNVNSNYKGESGSNTQYNDFMAGKLDASPIPTDKKPDWEGDKPEKYISGNTSITSLQVNSTTKERWEQLFGKDGSNWKNQQDYTYDANKAAAYTIKPIMSNSDFLDGLFFSIDRQTLADDLMASPSSDWLAEAYLVDEDSGVSYDSTAAHKRAVKDWSPETYGYSTAIAQQKFSTAIDQLIADGSYKAGTKEKPTVITINLQVAGEVQKKNWANKVENFIETNFNAVGLDKGVKLDVVLPNPPANVLDVYAMMASGTYDLIWGGISGGTSDALRMIGPWLDDWNTGLGMSFGVDPKTVDGSIHYKGQSYSMQGIYYAVEWGSPVIITDGVYVGEAKKEQ